ncbi:NANOS1 family protein [Megaselia abdita]
MYKKQYVMGTDNASLNGHLNSIIYETDNEICRSLKRFAVCCFSNSEYSTSEQTINDFDSNGFDPIEDTSVPKSDVREEHNKYSFIDCKNKTRKMILKQNQPFCVFCENNNEPNSVVRSHSVKDFYGRVLCPKLRIYVCPICHVSGDYAHTIKYCPQKPIITMEDTIKFESSKLTRAFFKPGMKI